MCWTINRSKTIASILNRPIFIYEFYVRFNENARLFTQLVSGRLKLHISRLKCSIWAVNSVAQGTCASEVKQQLLENKPMGVEKVVLWPCGFVAWFLSDAVLSFLADRLDGVGKRCFAHSKIIHTKTNFCHTPEINISKM